MRDRLISSLWTRPILWCLFRDDVVDMHANYYSMMIFSLYIHVCQQFALVAKSLIKYHSILDFYSVLLTYVANDPIPNATGLHSQLSSGKWMVSVSSSCH